MYLHEQACCRPTVSRMTLKDVKIKRMCLPFLFLGCRVKHMKSNMRHLSWILAIIASMGSVQLGAINVADYAVQVSARIQESPPLITLAWPADPDATGYTVY